jgi:hypothetical protein
VQFSRTIALTRRFETTERGVAEHLLGEHTRPERSRYHRGKVIMSSTVPHGDLASQGAGDADPPLTLPDVYAGQFDGRRWNRKETSWTIVTPQAKLVTKYTHGTSAIFSHYVFRFPHLEPDRITNVDMSAADSLMGANISAQTKRWTGIESRECQDELASVLRRIPVCASIEDASFDADVDRAIKILNACEGVQLAIATKLLCIKRPYLIPMMDSLVQDCLVQDRSENNLPLEILQQFRRLLAIPEISMRIDALADRIAAITGFVLSRVRILDELIWFDWSLRPPDEEGICRCVNFPNWVYDIAHHARGVYCPRQ